MRASALILFSALAFGADTGLPPRPSSQDYPVHETAGTATIAAAIVPPDQVAKMFSSSISRQYVVVEVGIYPQDGNVFDVAAFDFSLKIGGQISRADRARDVAPWPEKPSQMGGRIPVNVTTEAGVIIQQGNDPVYGRRSGVGTYEGVGVETRDPRDPRGPAPPSRSGPDPAIVEEKVQDKALPDGTTRKAVAGYLYFPQYGKKRKSDPIELDYSKDDLSVKLVFPK